MKVVCNSGPLIALSKLGQINLLYALYGTILIPLAVFEESVLEGKMRGDSDAISVEMAIRQQHLHISEIVDPEMSKEISALPLDRGEKHAIQLAMNVHADLILLDDLLARENAKNLGLNVQGTLGVLVDAFRENRLSISEVDIIFETILKRDDIWLSEDLVRRVWDQVKD